MNITLLLTVYTHCLKFIPKTPTVHLIALPTNSFHNIDSKWQFFFVWIFHLRFRWPTCLCPT